MHHPDDMPLADLLAEQIDLNDAVKATQDDDLSVLAAGRRAPDPAKLLSSKEFGGIVAALLQKFDRVVIDPPPVNAVTDALFVLVWGHASCLVVRAGKRLGRAVRRVIDQLRIAHAGFVLNRRPIHGRSAGYYYYHYGTTVSARGINGSKAPTGGTIAKR
jgi:polysaccharide biosynthesis transport protein